MTTRNSPKPIKANRFWYTLITSVAYGILKAAAQLVDKVLQHEPTLYKP